jgi:hypothetical protein
VIVWLDLLFHTFWIVGLALLLATFSLASWLTPGPQTSLWQRLTKPPFRLTIAISLFLFSLGLLLVTEPWGYKIGWAGLMALSLREGITAWQK